MTCSDVNRIIQIQISVSWNTITRIYSYENPQKSLDPILGTPFWQEKVHIQHNREKYSHLCDCLMCVWGMAFLSVCVFLSDFFSISVNLRNYILTEGGIKPSFIYWDDEYDSVLLYRLHICRQTHINLRLWWCCSEGCVIKHCYMRKWINL